MISATPRRTLVILIAAIAAAVPLTAAAAPRASTTPRCFGAAARDPRHPCSNPKLRHSVTPPLNGVDALPNGPCERQGTVGGQKVCGFGASPRSATSTVALIGDSHTTHWRAGVDVMARARGWRALQLGHQSCPLSRAVRALPEPTFSSCLRWKQAVFAWLDAHPEISTVFVSELSGGSGVIPSGGRSVFETEIRGYLEAWHRLPSSVRHVVVIRDDPKRLAGTPACLRQAIRRHARLDRACPMPRAAVLDADPAIVAARRLHSKKVRIIDFTPFFCGEQRCFEVIGGVLVHQDQNHMTAAFSETLGPFLLRAVDHLLPPAPAAPPSP